MKREASVALGGRISAAVTAMLNAVLINAMNPMHLRDDDASCSTGSVISCVQFVFTLFIFASPLAYSFSSGKQIQAEVD